MLLLCLNRPCLSACNPPTYQISCRLSLPRTSASPITAHTRYLACSWFASFASYGIVTHRCAVLSSECAPHLHTCCPAPSTEAHLPAVATTYSLATPPHAHCLSLAQCPYPPPLLHFQLVNNSRAGEMYLLYQCGTPNPQAANTEMDLPPGTKVFEIPLASVAVTDSNAAAFLVSWPPNIAGAAVDNGLLAGGTSHLVSHSLGKPLRFLLGSHPLWEALTPSYLQHRCSLVDAHFSLWTFFVALSPCCSCSLSLA